MGPPVRALQTWQTTLATMSTWMNDCSFGSLSLDTATSVVADYANFNCSVAQLDM